MFPIEPAGSHTRQHASLGLSLRALRVLRGEIRGAVAWRAFAVLVLPALLAPIAISAAAPAAPSTATAKPTDPVAQAIPLAEVATRAAETATLLRTLSERSVAKPETEAIERHLPETTRLVELEQATTNQVLEGQPSLATIAAQQQLWKERQTQLARWLALLTERATSLQDSLNRLTDAQATWRQTRATAVASRAPAALLRQIDDALAAIQALQASLQSRRGVALGLQGQVAQAASQCEVMVSAIARAQQQAVGGMLVRDAPPIWSPDLWAEASPDVLSDRVRQITALRWGGIRKYAQDLASRPASYLGALLLLALLLAAWSRARHGKAIEDNDVASSVWRRPFAAACIVPVLVASSPDSAVPSAIRQVVLVLGLVPTIRLMAPAIDPDALVGLYALAGLFAVDVLGQVYAGAPVVGQLVLVMEMVAGVVLLLRARRIQHLRAMAGAQREVTPIALVRRFAGALAIILAAALVAGALGFMRPARLVASGVVGSAALAITLYALTRVAAGVAAFALQVWPFQELHMVQQHRGLLERRVVQVVDLLAIAVWLLRSLDYVGLLHPVLAGGRAILTARLQRGAVSLSFGEVVECVLTVGVAYLVSAFIRFVLEEDIYPRTGMALGVSYAVSSVINYLILLLGFVLGLGALGVDFTKIGLLAGALGVGIGFGLQGVVNNFVSGLILLFERPLRVGDMVEIGELTAEVRRIGIRASTVRTFQNAEIIVPNSKLISEQLTNWTRTERRRRVDLSVGVSFGCHPGKVIVTLETAARSHPGVATTPPPQAFFVGFGESGMNFQLHSWTERFEDWFQLRSELGAAVYDALAAAGMSFAFPVREVRVHGDEGAGSQCATGS